VRARRANQQHGCTMSCHTHNGTGTALQQKSTKA